jgi:hypothetical protein
MPAKRKAFTVADTLAPGHTVLLSEPLPCPAIGASQLLREAVRKCVVVRLTANLDALKIMHAHRVDAHEDRAVTVDVLNHANTLVLRMHFGFTSRVASRRPESECVLEGTALPYPSHMAALVRANFGDAMHELIQHVAECCERALPSAAPHGCIPDLMLRSSYTIVPVGQ